VILPANIARFRAAVLLANITRFRAAVLLANIARFRAAVLLANIARFRAAVLLADIARFSAAVLLLDIARFSAAVLLADIARFSAAVLLLDIDRQQHVDQVLVLNAQPACLRDDVVQSLDPRGADTQMQQIVEPCELAVVEADGKQIIQTRIVRQTLIVNLIESAVVNRGDRLRQCWQTALQSGNHQQQSAGDSTDFHPAPRAALRTPLGNTC
jgi:hypothetical protein